MILARRRAGILVRYDTIPKSRRLIDSEEKAIVQYILELDICVFLPKLCGIEDIANQLLHVCDAPFVGKL